MPTVGDSVTTGPAAESNFAEWNDSNARLCAILMLSVDGLAKAVVCNFAGRCIKSGNGVVPTKLMRVETYRRNRKLARMDPTTT